MKQAAKDFAGKVMVAGVLLDVQVNVKYAEKYQVNVVPTYVFLDSEGNIVDRAVGALDKNTLYAKMKSVEGK